MRKRFQFFIFFLQAFIGRHKRHIIFAGIISFFITLFFIQTYPFYVEKFGRKHNRIGVIGRYTDTTLPSYIKGQISLGLTSLTPRGEATASLAKSWDIDEKGTSYTFHLYPNIIWHDGKKFTAKDINYQFGGATFTPVNDTTLKVTLKEPYAPFPVLLSKPLLHPNLIGVGMYKITNVERSEDSFTSMTMYPDDKTLPILTYKFYPNTNDALLAFKLGEIDSINNLQSINDLKTWNNIKIYETTQYDRYVGIFFNLKNSLFKEKEVRQALAYAMPTIEDTEKALTPLSPLSWAYSRKIRLYNQNLDTAQKILAKSPLSSESAQITLSTFAPHVRTAQQIADTWNSIGLNVKVKVESSINADYELFLLTQVIPPDPDQYHYWQSTQEQTNITHYGNPKIDKLLEDGRKTLDQEARKKIYADFQRYLVDDSPVIFLYYPKTYNIERK